MSNTWYYTWAVLLLLGNLGGFTATVFGLPGTWLIVLFSTLFTLLVHPAAGGGLTWWACGGVLLLAVAGEILEFAVGAAGAAKQGASRRAMVLATLGAMGGSFGGSAVGSGLLPIVGTVVGAILGGGVGAFAGAWLGEYWRGSDHQKGLAVGTAAFIGRLLGTLSKLLVAASMVALATWDSFWN